MYEKSDTNNESRGKETNDVIIDRILVRDLISRLFIFITRTTLRTPPKGDPGAMGRVKPKVE